MTTFTRADDLSGASFVEANLRGARFVEADLSGAVMRGVELDSVDIDSPWLPHAAFLRVNGVDVIPLVEAELDRRFPGRAERRAGDPDTLGAAWAALERAWAPVLERAAAMPPGTVDVSVDGEWSFAQTLRHLVMATDLWLGQAVLGLEEPFHPLGLRHDDTAQDIAPAPYDEVLAARSDRVALVRDFLAGVTEEELAVPRSNPHDPGHQETTLSCVHTVLEEEWEHLRFAVRDLDTISSRA